eukprot:6179509-Pleurochrysis_carterae.AAC.2
MALPLGPEPPSGTRVSSRPNVPQSHFSLSWWACLPPFPLSTTATPSTAPALTLTSRARSLPPPYSVRMRVIASRRRRSRFSHSASFAHRTLSTSKFRPSDNGVWVGACVLVFCVNCAIAIVRLGMQQARPQRPRTPPPAASLRSPHADSAHMTAGVPDRTRTQLTCQNMRACTCASTDT